MPTRKRLDRISRIIEILRTSNGASIRELSGALGVSEMTIRRDLDDLARQNAVRFLRAGAVLASGEPGDTEPGHSLVRPESPRSEEEARIGKKAASLIEPGDVAIIDAGSTTEWLVRSIPLDMSMTVLCYSLNILMEARRRAGVSAILAGGALRKESLIFESPEGIELVRRYRAVKAFLCAAGASAQLGVTCPTQGEAELKRTAIASSRVRILLADSGIFGRVSPAWFADLKDFDAVVTDSGISLEYVDSIQELGIAIHVV